jgi:hypothetical protein
MNTRIRPSGLRGSLAALLAAALVAGCADGARRHADAPDHPANPSAPAAADVPKQPAASEAAPAPAGPHHHGDAAPPAAVAAPAAPAATPDPAGRQHLLDAAVAAYLDVQRALAKDDLPGANSALDRLRPAADDLAKSGAGDVAAAARGVAAAVPPKATEIRALRDAFKSLSAATIELVHAMRPGSDVAPAVRIVYCPMADASWVQTEAKASNPYFGAEMPTCGTVKETLAAAPGGK